MSFYYSLWSNNTTRDGGEDTTAVREQWAAATMLHRRVWMFMWTLLCHINKPPNKDVQIHCFT